MDCPYRSPLPAVSLDPDPTAGNVVTQSAPPPGKRKLGPRQPCCGLILRQSVVPKMPCSYAQGQALGPAPEMIAKLGSLH